MHGDAVAIAGKQQSRQHDASAEVQRTVERMPAFRAFDVEAQIVVRKMIAELVPHFIGEKPQFCGAEQTVHVEPRARAADRLLDSTGLLPGNLRSAGET